MARQDVSTATTPVWIDSEKRHLIVDRTFDAPRDLVWAAFTEPDRLAKWWGPRQWDTTNKTMDVRPGGIWHYCMTGPAGMESWGTAEYKEITPKDRIVYRDWFSDADGNANDQMPSVLTTFEFQDAGAKKTRVFATAEYATVEALKQVTAMGMVQGLSESLDKLAEHLAE
jgi:uncharacterized protein YndB with AHSA1/START domain